MKDYLLLYRADFGSMPQRTPDEAAANTKKWMDWLQGIAAENKLTDNGKRLAASGRVVRGNDMVTNGPYAEIKESLGGYSVVKAGSYEEAVDIAKSCPVLSMGGNVEVREIDVL
jgi:hypothetical protein